MRLSHPQIYLAVFFSFICIYILGQNIREQCDNNIKPDKSLGDHQYKNRGEYCEGMIVKPASTSINGFHLVNCTESALHYNFERDDTLIIRTRYAFNPVSIKISSIRTNSYYQLDGTTLINTPIFLGYSHYFEAI